MAQRVMYVQLKTGYDTDRGPAWISWVDFSRTWNTAYFDGHTLRRAQSIDGNFVDTDTGEEYWLSAPKRDRTDGRYSDLQPTVSGDAKAPYEAFLQGAPLPGRESG